MSKKVTSEPTQITQNVVMIRPKKFGFNPETAGNNSFQNNETDLTREEISSLAIKEFDEFVTKLRSVGINVNVFDDLEKPYTPDAVFPNNWFSLHNTGMVISYPMFAPIRRQERRPDIIQSLTENFHVNKDYTFEHYEEEDLFLEGTGSLILDRINRIVYAALSPRTNISLLNKWSILMGYEKINFTSVDRNGMDIYHTNVMMALGLDFVVICLESIQDETELKKLKNAFSKTGKTIIDISYAQMEAFAGNMLQLQGSNNDHYLVMSESAYNSLTDTQIKQIESHTNILVGKIPTIEKFGGGSVRCMIAENFLPEKQS